MVFVLINRLVLSLTVFIVSLIIVLCPSYNWTATIIKISKCQTWHLKKYWSVLRWGLLFWVVSCSRKSEIFWLVQVVEETYGDSNWKLTSNLKNLGELGLKLPLKLGVYQSALEVPRRICPSQLEMIRTSVTCLIHMILCTLFEISLEKI